MCTLLPLTIFSFNIVVSLQFDGTFFAVVGRRVTLFVQLGNVTLTHMHFVIINLCTFTSTVIISSDLVTHVVMSATRLFFCARSQI